MKTIVLAAEADRALSKMPEDLQERFLTALMRYGASGQGDVKRLTAAGGSLRLRLGDHRIVFRDEGDRLLVLTFAHRSTVYR